MFEKEEANRNVKKNAYIFSNFCNDYQSNSSEKMSQKNTAFCGFCQIFCASHVSKVVVYFPKVAKWEVLQLKLCKTKSPPCSSGSHCGQPP